MSDEADLHIKRLRITPTRDWSENGVHIVTSYDDDTPKDKMEAEFNEAESEARQVKAT